VPTIVGKVARLGCHYNPLKDSVASTLTGSSNNALDPVATLHGVCNGFRTLPITESTALSAGIQLNTAFFNVKALAGQSLALRWLVAQEVPIGSGGSPHLAERHPKRQETLAKGTDSRHASCT
jgi:hypothetical protein